MFNCKMLTSHLPHPERKNETKTSAITTFVQRCTEGLSLREGLAIGKKEGVEGIRLKRKK